MFRMAPLFVACVAAWLVGCSSSGSNPGDKKAPSLVGTWEAREPDLKGVTLVMTFTADGKFTRETVMQDLPKEANVTVDGGKQEGTYKQQDKTITLSAGGNDRTMTIKDVSDAKLVLANPENKELTFTKKK
jgi:uncharacterized protein (TIGR03066 family)